MMTFADPHPGYEITSLPPDSPTPTKRNSYGWLASCESPSWPRYCSIPARQDGIRKDKMFTEGMGIDHMHGGVDSIAVMRDFEIKFGLPLSLCVYCSIA